MCIDGVPLTREQSEQATQVCHKAIAELKHLTAMVCGAADCTVPPEISCENVDCPVMFPELAKRHKARKDAAD